MLAVPLALAPRWDGLASPPAQLAVGLLAVAVGHLCVLGYHWVRAAPPRYAAGVRAHLAQPEGFGLLAGYLAASWLGGWMPRTYYDPRGGVRWGLVLAQLLLADLLQFGAHRGLHRAKPLYRACHRAHHRHTAPGLLDAFDGSVPDTCLMVLAPLALTAAAVPANLWSYVAFGTLYANWLTLLHAEYEHPWDPAFRRLGLGTPADHRVHHRLLVRNYGHTFTYWDRLCGTYQPPCAA